MNEHVSQGTDAGNPAKPVRDEDAFDVAAVDAWLREHAEDEATALVDGLVGLPDVQQFPGGASNLTYLLRYQTADGTCDLILRRPPSGVKAKGAHDMGREYTIQSGLAPLFPFVPTMVGHCTDDAVIGSEFYVMDKLDGLIPRTDFGFEISAEQVDALCEHALEVLVALHSVDLDQAPTLAGFDKGDGYVDRQVGGWIRRFGDARTDDVGDWSDVIAWLEERKPRDVAQCLIHNDYRFDNMVLDRDDPTKVIGVLDWEMATVGDPLMELGGITAYWVQADDDEFFQAFRRQPTTAPGMWTRAELVERYCERMGYSVTPEEWRFYEVFGVFRIAVILQQIWYRYVHKQTTNESYAVFGDAVDYLQTRARGLIAGA